MKKIILLFCLSVSIVQVKGQKNRRENKSSEVWWTIYGQAQILPKGVNITAGETAAGYGSGHTLVFASKEKKDKRIWPGLEFNHHYFGRKKINSFRVFYETWQLSFLTRFSMPDNKLVVPFVDISGGVRLMVSFTANNREYGGLLFRRFIDIIAAKEGGVNVDMTDHKIVKEYNRFMPVTGIGAGCWIKGKNFRGLSIKGMLHFGAPSRFADYDAVQTEQDTYNYAIKKGSGRFFNIQLGYSFRM